MAIIKTGNSSLKAKGILIAIAAFSILAILSPSSTSKNNTTPSSNQPKQQVVTNTPKTKYTQPETKGESTQTNTPVTQQQPTTAPATQETPSETKTPVQPTTQTIVPSEPVTQSKTSCCMVCKKGKACGDSCISRSKICHKGVGCACNGY